MGLREETTDYGVGDREVKKRAVVEVNGLNSGRIRKRII